MNTALEVKRRETVTLFGSSKMEWDGRFSALHPVLKPRHQQTMAPGLWPAASFCQQRVTRTQPSSFRTRVHGHFRAITAALNSQQRPYGLPSLKSWLSGPSRKCAHQSRQASHVSNTLSYTHLWTFTDAVRLHEDASPSSPTAAFSLSCWAHLSSRKPQGTPEHQCPGARPLSTLSRPLPTGKFVLHTPLHASPS